MTDNKNSKMTTIHLSQSIDGLLRYKNLTDVCESDEFKTDKDIRNELLRRKAAGELYISVGECDNFDPKVGCLGHPSEAPNV